PNVTSAPLNKKNIKKRPFSSVQSTSGQNKRFVAFGRESEKELSSLILQHQLVTKNQQPLVHVRSIQLDVNNKNINLNYHSFNKKMELSKLDATIRACDESLLSRDGYRRLAAIEPQLIREHQVAIRRIEITNIMNEKIRIGTFNTDEVLNRQSKIGNGDTIELKLGGDGYNVGHKQNYVMMTVCLLNEDREVLKPDHQY
ncbi:14874_t:CDS:2, partial [Cetraspora pellucida]